MPLISVTVQSAGLTFVKAWPRESHKFVHVFWQRSNPSNPPCSSLGAVYVFTFETREDMQPRNE